LGLSHPANDSLFNKEIYGVIPYIAPEIFKGAKFSHASDIYSLGMIMWECTTGCKPFANIEHDQNLIYNIIDGKRPEITEDTPEFLANLMKRCWDSDPKNRPTAWEILFILPIKYNSLELNYYAEPYYISEMRESEQKRLELIRLKKLGPKFTEKPHSKAIYTSRPLKSLYTNSSNSLTKSLFSVNSSNTKQGYISREYEFDIKGSQSSSLTDTKSSLSRANIKGSNNKKYDSKELEFDID
ncbi:kinase-like protein, partial [Rhizophagus irregularis]